METTSYAATGRRKEAVARATLTPGKGKFIINDRDITDYLSRDTLAEDAKKPLVVTETVGTVDVQCRARGGGPSGQSGAVRLAVARALVLMNAEFRRPLREAGLLTRDARQVERKKYGQPKARKRFQYSKR